MEDLTRTEELPAMTMRDMVNGTEAKPLTKTAAKKLILVARRRLRNAAYQANNHRYGCWRCGPCDLCDGYRRLEAEHQAARANLGELLAQHGG